jgi:acetyl-CoA acetyltransferase
MGDAVIISTARTAIGTAFKADIPQAAAPGVEGFSITPGNSSGINDGAAAVVIADRALADTCGLAPLAEVRAWASVGVPPAEAGLAPTRAIPKALSRAGLTIDDVDLWEINEAFAAMCVGTTRILGIDEERVNVLGSGCSVGHPVAMRAPGW